MEDNNYFDGSSLRGDNFSLDKIEKWFEDEKEGYANLGAKNKDTYRYVYHELNKMVSFKYLKNEQYDNVLGIGSAYGEEFVPIIDKIQNITIIDPSDSFSTVNNIFNTPCKYIKPTLSGDLSFKDNTFDLITSFGVFHHIPNVTHVFNEANIVLKSGGIMCIREPIVSMGDWSKPRRGLTKNERGIPYQLFIDIAQKAGFKIVKSTVCDFPPLSILSSKVGISTFDSKLLTAIDLLLSKIFKWNINYHPISFKDRFRPASLSLVLEKK